MLITFPFTRSLNSRLPANPVSLLSLSVIHHFKIPVGTLFVLVLLLLLRFLRSSPSSSPCRQRPLAAHGAHFGILVPLSAETLVSKRAALEGGVDPGLNLREYQLDGRRRHAQVRYHGLDARPYEDGCVGVSGVGQGFKGLQRRDPKYGNQDNTVLY